MVAKMLARGVKKKAPPEELCELDLASLRQLLAEGKISAEEVVDAHLARIEKLEETVGAWAHLDTDFARVQARALDRHRKYGRPLGPLHGVPVGIKDIIDVKGLPCEYGTPLSADRQPQNDATCVARLRDAGAVILGKTVTTELAVYHPGKTKNPHDPERTPGGSSSGSAAAVAARMVPLAVGSQTNGSVIRPASYCGVVGFKPSSGVISRYGALVQSPTLDTLGVFAGSVEEAAAMADAMTGYDPLDSAMSPGTRPQLLDQAVTDPPVPPRFAFVPSPVWSETEHDLRVGFDELLTELAGQVDRIDLPKTFQHGHAMHRALHVADIARNYARFESMGRDQLSEAMQGLIDAGREVKAVDYIVAKDGINLLNDALEELLTRYSAIITPAASGEAPRGLDSTGSPAFCTLWTYCGVPAISLPLLVGENGMPIGVQLVGRRGEDGRLLRIARWLVERLRVEETADSA